MVVSLVVCDLKEEYDYLKNMSKTYDELIEQHNKAVYKALKGATTENQKTLLELIIAR